MAFKQFELNVRAPESVAPRFNFSNRLRQEASISMKSDSNSAIARKLSIAQDFVRILRNSGNGEMNSSITSNTESRAESVMSMLVSMSNIYIAANVTKY
jgi:hypothetical protein